MARQSAVASIDSAVQASKQPEAQEGAEPANNTGSVQFSSSVILFDVGDVTATVRQNGRVANWCALIANNIKQFGSDKINFVLTQYWMPTSNSTPFDIDYFCYKERGGGRCRKFTKEAIKRFEERMTECFAIAISQGFKTIMVTPHIDNAVDAYQWRNYAKLNPGLAQGGFSYWDIQLAPLAAAIHANLGKGAQRFLFNLGGELGTSFFGWSGKWLQFVGDARQAALGKDKAKHAGELQVGLKVNFERVPGYASQLPGGVKRELAQQLFAALDYVAISAYAPVPAKPDPSHFQDSVAIADGELQQLGISLAGRDIWYGEFGIGGGTSQYCDRLAKTPAEAGFTPMYGTCWQYNPAMNPWKSPAIRSYMQAYYAAALQWLQQGAPGGKWRVKGVFAWNLVSWDVQGVHPLSYAGDGASFKDDKVSVMIAQHNKAASR